jgi:hypothetical protein
MSPIWDRRVAVPPTAHVHGRVTIESVAWQAHRATCDRGDHDQKVSADATARRLPGTSESDGHDARKRESEKTLSCEAPDDNAEYACQGPGQSLKGRFPDESGLSGLPGGMWLVATFRTE